MAWPELLRPCTVLIMHSGIATVLPILEGLSAPDLIMEACEQVVAIGEETVVWRSRP